MPAKEGFVIMVEDTAMGKKRFFSALDSFVTALAAGHCHGWDRGAQQSRPFPLSVFFDADALANGDWSLAEQNNFIHAVHQALAHPLPGSTRSLVNGDHLRAVVRHTLQPGTFGDTLPSPTEGKTAYRAAVRKILIGGLP